VDTATPARPAREGDTSQPVLGVGRKIVYGLGDLTLNTALSSLSLIYATYFLTQVAGLRPALAGLVPLLGRAVDAFTDPAMGRISDLTPWRGGRRRPYFLIGAIPFGICFALLWQDVPLASQAARFGYYVGVYCLFSVAMTVVSVPYLAIQPEMALGYDERTSLNTFRTMGSILGIFAAVSLRPASEALGGGSVGFERAGIVFGILVALPWLAVHRATFERPGFRRPPNESFREGLAWVFRHSTFTRLTALYIMGRIAMDLAGALLILYTAFWLGRSGDFELVMILFLGAVVLALPLWLALSRGRDKSRVFILGALWWSVASLGLAVVQPDWPRWLLFLYVPLVGVGFAVVDLMPWSMLGEVIDEDEAAHGERREGIYNGVFTFIRKLGGAIGVFLVMSILDLAGFVQGDEQTETARQAVRWMAAAGPAFFLLLAVWMARGYPLTRERHREILKSLERD